MAEYGNHRGRPIVGVGVIVRKTGDGLSEAADLDPEMAQFVANMDVGDEGFIVFEYQMVDDHHPAENRKTPAEGGVRRLVVLDAGTATFMDGDAVAENVRAQRERNDRARSERQGQHQLDDAKLVAAHDDGEHAGDVFPVDHCPRCAEEVAAVQAENDE